MSMTGPSPHPVAGRSPGVGDGVGTVPSQPSNSPLSVASGDPHPNVSFFLNLGGAVKEAGCVGGGVTNRRGLKDDNMGTQTPPGSGFSPR